MVIMSEYYIKLLNLIEKKATLNEITHELKLSREQIYKVFRELKLMGMDFTRKYYYNGEFIYLPRKEIDLPNKKNCVNIITERDSDTFRCVAISDLHIGSIYQSEESWNMIMDYCVVNNIHTIIITGDFLDGISIGSANSKIHSEPIQQIEYALKKYPTNEGILNYLTFGNHDVDYLVSYGVDLSTIICNFRHDIVPVGYGYGRINIKNDRILITHPLGIGGNKDLDLDNNYLLLKGHHHLCNSIIGSNGNCSLNIPSLSNIFLTKNEFLPGAIDISIKFRGGFFDTIYYSQLLISNKVININSTQFSITHPKGRKFDGDIKYEEVCPKKRSLIPNNK